MKNKLTGLLMCVGILLAGLFSAYLVSYGGFYHQHREQEKQPTIDIANLESGDWTAAETTEEDRLLRNYVFCNLAGDVCGYGPVTGYTEDRSGAVVQMRQTVPAALAQKASFIVCLLPTEGTESMGEPLNTFGIYRHLIKTGRSVRFVYPKDEKKEKIEEIRKELCAFEKTLYSYDFDSTQYHYSTFIDPESFIRTFIITELAGPLEGSEIPFYFFEDRDGKYSLCVCDYIRCAKDAEQDFRLTSAFWYTMLLRDSAFVDGIVNEYAALRKSRLSDEYLEAYIAEASAFVDSSFSPDRSTAREAEELRTYLKKRLVWMDENIESLYQYCARSNIKNYTDDPY